MTNAVRGEVKLTVPGKGEFNLCLSLGALAEIETELGIDDISQIGTKLQKPKSTDVARLVTAMVHGGGHEDVTLEDVMKWPVSLANLMGKVKLAMKATDVEVDETDGSGDQSEGNAKAAEASQD